MAKTVREEAAKLRQNMDRIYDAGQKAEYDHFWDGVQRNGERTNYANVFCYWFSDGIYPKYDISSTSYQQSFMSMGGNPLDLTERLDSCGVKLITENCTNFDYMFFSNPAIRRIPEINTTKIANLNCMFLNCINLHTVDKLILKSDGSQKFTQTFQQCNYLANIVVDGVIGTSLNMQWCPLTNESLISIVSCLKNYDGTDKAKSYTLTLSEACRNALGMLWVDSIGLPLDYGGPDNLADYIDYIGWNLA